jgi:uracil-DNA glycosylase
VALGRLAVYLCGMENHAETGDLGSLAREIAACRICADRFAATATAHEPRPVPWLSARAPVLIAGQAPGARVHASGRPFDDPSGDRLRGWLGVDRDTFYDRSRFAVLPMAFCFPGYDARGSDLPPPRVCAATWRTPALAAMPQVRLTLLIGAHAHDWHLGRQAGGVTERVRRWRERGDAVIPLPHPSWRNTGWLKRNPWFEAELLPVLQARVAILLAEPA